MKIILQETNAQFFFSPKPSSWNWYWNAHTQAHPEIILQETNAQFFFLPNQAEEAVRSVVAACFSRSNTLRLLKNNLLHQWVCLRWAWEGIMSTILWSVAMMPLLLKGRRSERGIRIRGVHQPEHIGAEEKEYYWKNKNLMVKSCNKSKRFNVIKVSIHFRDTIVYLPPQTAHKKNCQPALSMHLLPFKQTWFFWLISGNDRHFTTHSAHPELINTTTDIRLDFIHLLTTRKCTIQQNSIHYKRFY